jgi:rhodanese-related sulfurtransferase
VIRRQPRRALRGVCAVVGLAALQVSAACAPEAAVAAAVPVSAVADATASCAPITIAELASIAAPRLIDARAPVADPRVRIAEATSVDGAPLPSNGDTAVVIGSGWDTGGERRACAALIAKGYTSVVVLRGGARAWVRAGLPIWSDAGGPASLDVATAAEAHAAAVRGDAELVVLPDASAPVACPADVPNLHCVRSYRDAVDVLRRARGSAVPMLSASDRDYARARSRLGRADVMQVSGGPAAMRRHLDHFQSIARSSGQALWIPCHRR